MFLDEVIAAKNAGLTEVSAKVQEIRMAECKICTGGINSEATK
jgi:hypothetical protein